MGKGAVRTHVTRAGYIVQDGSTLGIVAKVGRTWHYQAKQADGMFGPASEGFRTQSAAVIHLCQTRLVIQELGQDRATIEAEQRADVERVNRESDDATLAANYREQVRQSGDSAELAAIDGMSDAFVAAAARGDKKAMTRALEAES